MKKLLVIALLCIGLTPSVQTEGPVLINFIKRIFSLKGSFLPGKNGCTSYNLNFLKIIFKDNGWCKLPHIKLPKI